MQSIHPSHWTSDLTSDQTTFVVGFHDSVSVTKSNLTECDRSELLSELHRDFSLRLDLQEQPPIRTLTGPPSGGLCQVLNPQTRQHLMGFHGAIIP
jgi:hypothetical protein